MLGQNSIEVMNLELYTSHETSLKKKKEKEGKKKAFGRAGRAQISRSHFIKNGFLSGCNAHSETSSILWPMANFAPGSLAPGSLATNKELSFS